MPRGRISKDELKAFISELKIELYETHHYGDANELAHKYLNKVLDKINEFRE